MYILLAFWHFKNIMNVPVLPTEGQEVFCVSKLQSIRCSRKSNMVSSLFHPNQIGIPTSRYSNIQVLN